MAKSSATTAREKARKAMLEMQKQRAERDARVTAQVEQFYVGSVAVDAAAEKLEAAQAAYEQAQSEARDGQAQVVQALIGEKLTESEIASLCGITVVQVRSLRRLAVNVAAPDGDASNAAASDTGSNKDADAPTVPAASTTSAA